MNVRKFPVPAAERWTLSRDLDTLRFDILSARAVADRLRQKGAAEFLAETTASENIQNTLAHIDSILDFFSEVNELMRQRESSEEGERTEHGSSFHQ